MSSPRSLIRDIIHGALGFMVVSIAAFSIWAFAGSWFRSHGGELAMYSAIAAVFLLLSGLFLGPLAGGIGRFYRAFLPAFLVYAVLWCVVWFSLPNRTGEVLAGAVGGLVFTWLSMKTLGNSRGWFSTGIFFVVLYSAGYFAGDWAMHGYWLDKKRLTEFPSLSPANLAIIAKLSWGLCYGLGFGTGLGTVFHQGRRGSGNSN